MYNKASRKLNNETNQIFYLHESKRVNGMKNFLFIIAYEIFLKIERFCFCDILTYSQTMGSHKKELVI